MSEHARLSPSGAHRWIRCPGSVALCDEIGERDSSEFAAEGTVAHHIREMCLEFDLEPHVFVGQVMSADGYTFTVTEDMADNLVPGIEFVREQPGRVVNEYRVSFDRWLPEQFGTLDVGIISPRRVIINDLKYGAGMPVSAYQNEQLMTYALGFWDNVARHETDATDFLLVVDQPRARATSAVIEDFDDDEDDGDTEQVPQWGGEWKVTLDELLAFGEKLKTAYDLATSPDAWLRAGEKQCQFCPAKGICEEYARWSMTHLQLELHDLDPDVISLKDHGEFTPQQRSNAALNADRVRAWLKAVHAQVMNDAKAGRPTPGAKLVVGKQGPRKWADPEAAEAFVLEHLDFESAFTDPALISPAQFEKVKTVPKDVKQSVNDYTVRSEGKLALVGADDRRPGYDLADEFDDD